MLTNLRPFLRLWVEVIVALYVISLSIPSYLD